MIKYEPIIRRAYGKSPLHEYTLCKNSCCIAVIVSDYLLNPFSEDTHTR